MLRWIRRISAGASAGLLIVFYALHGEPEILVLMILITGMWLMVENFPNHVRVLIRLIFVLSYTGFTVYAILIESNFVGSIAALTGSFVSWNVDMFLTRWPEAPGEQQRRYLRSLGAIMSVSIGIVAAGAGMQGRLNLSFPVIFILMLMTGVWALRCLLRLAKNA
ncbi:hypothetical protein U27_00127 [Candidatus Vecturithrix granuli]|uniref:Uncharacterized protein n=1 Tax=Vecturithrix granuli TaxID=1499967 RepID=A0A081C6N1_VECG1|nr:hypothetical protein U27_00127 [Candidatus Vecturithrix granuli]